MTVSIIMGIYNCAETLRDAIESILNQTFTDWELIMCDDGSRDATYAIASEYSARFPQKIITLKNDQNFGLNATLNKCLSFAKGRFIARMDGDDLCDPSRLEEEVAVLENEKDIAIVSTGMSFFDENGSWGNLQFPAYPQKQDFLKGTPFCHAAAMVRKEAFDAVGGYSVESKLLRVEDYHLWLKMYREGFKGKNIQKILYSMRDDLNAYKRRKFCYRINESYVIRLAVKELNLPRMGYLYALRPIAVGLLPLPIYNFLHKQRLKKRLDLDQTP